MSKHLVVVAGGTGGHIFPGIAVAQYMQNKDWCVSWIGTDDRMEADVVPKHGIDIDYINVQGVRGNGAVRKLKAPFMIMNAFLQARKILKHRKPSAVLAMGGYVTGPTGLAAKSLGIPLIIHEQNAVAGMSNKLLSKVANHTLLAFPDAIEAANTNVVGNPVRATLMAIEAAQVQVPVNILVVGGSLGAKALNDTLPEAFAQLMQQASINVWHQSGKGRSAALIQEYDKYKVNAQVSEFIDDMNAAYQWADIVVCRAGALTVSEIAAVGRMALFVPYPHAVDDHQTANASFLVSQQGALLLAQQSMTAQRVVDLLQPYVCNPELITEMAGKAKSLAKLDATEQVAAYCEQYS